MADPEELAVALQNAAETGALHLSFLALAVVPPPVWRLTSLIRLDLGSNELVSVDPAIGSLTALEELWLNNNPLTSVPAELSNCGNLRLLHLQETELVKLPRELGRLPQLCELALEDTPRLRPELRAAYSGGGTLAVLALLARKDQRRQLKRALQERLSLEVYAGAATSEASLAALRNIVKAVLAAFGAGRGSDGGEAAAGAGSVTEAGAAAAAAAAADMEANLRLVIRNAARLFPERLEDFSLPALRARLLALQRDNLRKQLGADLELKLRALYAERLGSDPPLLARLLADIAAALPALEDVVFLLAHARELLPAAPQDISGAAVAAAVAAHRARLAAEREGAVGALVAAMLRLYPDREAREVEETAAAIAGRLPSSATVRALAADAGEVLPADMANLKVRAVLRAFTALQQEKGLA